MIRRFPVLVAALMLATAPARPGTLPSPSYGTVTAAVAVVLPDGTSVTCGGTASGCVALGPALAAEAATARAAEAANASAVSAETARAQGVEATHTSGLSANATAIGNEVSRAKSAEALLAPLASPALTGTPTAPTAAAGTNTTQLATTAFGTAAVAAEAALARNASNLTVGTVPAAQMPALTGDVSTAAGSTATAIVPGSVTNAKLANAAPGTVKANPGASAAAPSDVTVSALLDATFGSAQGAILYRSASGWSLLGPGSSGQVLGTGGAGANVSWQTLGGTGTVTQLNTGTGLTGGPITSSGTVALASAPAGTLKGNASGSSAAPADLTPAQSLGVLGLNNTGLESFRNRIIDGGFTVNQRGYASGTGINGGSYMHDRWRSGSTGSAYTFTQSYPSTTVTITAGSIQQVVEGINVEGGSYTLSWTGTAIARIYQGTATGSYAASPLTVTGLTAGSNITVEFVAGGSGGTLGKVQLEPGTAASAFEARPYAVELALCQRYFEQFLVPTVQSPAPSTLTVPWPFKAQKRVTPTVATVTAPTYSNASGASVSGTIDAANLQFTASAAGGYVSGWVVSASAEL